VVGASDAEIKVINIEKMELVGSLKSHEDAVNSLVIN
jgi:hypothetical protein